MSIKYYCLAKDEEPPEEFCAVRDIGGEPSEYMFYVPEAENAKLRKLLDAAHMSRLLTENENEELRSLVLALDECRHSACNDCKRWSSPDGCSIDDMMKALGMKGE